MVRAEVGRKVDIVVTPTDDHRSYHVSSERIRRELGFVAGAHGAGRDRRSEGRVRRRQGAERDDRRPLLQHQAHAGAEAAMNGRRPGARTQSTRRAGAPAAPMRGAAGRGAAAAAGVGLPHTSASFSKQPADAAGAGQRAGAGGALPCQFVLMTSARMPSACAEHPPGGGWLGRSARPEIEPHRRPDHRGQSLVTITLAYARAVRAAGAAMRDTCFLFLLSDYIWPTARWPTCSPHEAGASGVLAGNFQVVAEEALRGAARAGRRRARRGGAAARDLMRWALGASASGDGRRHRRISARRTHAQANRLFWRVDADTLIGRFYLLHMIAIRPEVSDFEIGSALRLFVRSGDVPERHKVEVVTDSDEYLVVEMQPRAYHAGSVRCGGPGRRRLARGCRSGPPRGTARTQATRWCFMPARWRDEIARSVAEADALHCAGLPASVGAAATPSRSPYWVGAWRSIARRRRR